MKWQKRFRISINLSENVLKRFENQHRLQKTLSIGLEIEQNVFEKVLKSVFLVE